MKRIMIAGPTASGKTALSIKLAEHLSGEIISVDSRQSYRYLDIGTAKPSKNELDKIPHHNISILDLKEKDSVAAFKNRADKYTEEIQSKDKTVIYCGGSTLHLQSIIKPLDKIPTSNSDNVHELEEIAEKKELSIYLTSFSLKTLNMQIKWTDLTGRGSSGHWMSGDKPGGRLAVFTVMTRFNFHKIFWCLLLIVPE